MMQVIMQNTQKTFLQTALALVLSAVPLPFTWAVEEPVDLTTVAVLGIKPAEFNIPKIREHLWNIGGFMQARSTIKQRNIDKFFAWSRIRDSYYLEVRYNHIGNVTSLKRLYRPYSIEQSNKRTAISTKDVALELIGKAGQPSRMVRKGWGGSLTYSSFEWEDDNIKIVVDREGSEKLGNVFVEYIVKNQSPYAIAQLE
ncbi:MAG: hypothetical protein JXK16_06040 [Thiotrichales bacterium]|nr:hypothetical protein [Thiotrichales bacterium]